jgi:hypothetical protein
LLWVFGTPAFQLWKSSVGSIVANALPARWAFEGLLVLESDRHEPLAAVASDPSRAKDGDLAEAYFPADNERMGARADAMALTFMFIGLAAGATFISAASSTRLGP